MHSQKCEIEGTGNFFLPVRQFRNKFMNKGLDLLSLLRSKYGEVQWALYIQSLTSQEH